MKRETVLERILLLMNDGEARTIRRIHFLTGVSLNSIRKALHAGLLVKVGEEPRPCPWARRGQAILQAPKKPTCRARSSRPSLATAAA